MLLRLFFSLCKVPQQHGVGFEFSFFVWYFYTARNDSCVPSNTCNFLFRELLRHPDVRFAGYRVPHPLDNHIELTVQTNEDMDAVSAVVTSVQNLCTELQHLRNEFEEQSRQMMPRPVVQENRDYNNYGHSSSSYYDR